MSAGASILTAKARVLVLEDAEQFACDLVKRLEATGRIECVSSSSLEHFVETVDHVETDAASIDWRLNGYDHGAHALDYLGEKQPDTGRLVYTFFSQEERAREHDADYFLGKQVTGGAGYVDAALAAVRLGLGRKVRACLGVSEAQQPINAATFDCEAETQLYAKAKDKVLEGVIQGSYDRILRNVLMRAGRWRAFNKSAYIKMPWRQKLSEVCAFAAVDPDALAKIIGIDPKRAEFLLYDCPDATLEPSTVEAADQLLSIFSYVLQMAEYEPEAVAYYWTITDLYCESRPDARPPWDRAGLSKYLQDGGPTGLEQAANWIWSH